jgi:hypothetical protein
MAMALPTWNQDWEKPDPLRGKPGWTFPDYVNIVIALVLAAIVLGSVMPPVLKARDLDAWMRRLNTMREQEFDRRVQQDLGR